MLIQPGSVVVYSSAGYFNKEINQCFRPLTMENLRKVQIGSEIWIEFLSCYSDGTSIGYACVEIESIDKPRPRGGTRRIKWKASGLPGGEIKVYSRERQVRNVFQLSNPTKLERLLQDQPRF